MMKLYDELYIGIPSGIKITGCVIGETWTAVRANGNVGLARTLELPEDPDACARGFVGRYLRDTGCHLRWDSLHRAAVGVAALNAWYNTAERVRGLEGDGPPEPFTGRTAYVGLPGEGDRFPLPMEAGFDAADYRALGGYDRVVIAAEALTTRALPGLLELAGEHVVLEGCSLPASALFFAFGMPVRELRGVYPRSPDAVETCALQNLPDPAPGVLPFCIRPLSVERIHERPGVRRVLDSPYGGSGFNSGWGSF